MTTATLTDTRVLSPEDHAHFHEFGYVIVRNAVPLENVRALIDVMHAFLGGIDRENWYKPPHTQWGFLPLHHNQAMWDNRQHPRVYRAFTELLGREDLWVTMDRVNVKLPAHKDHPGWGDVDFVHWDCDPRTPPRQLSLQGVLSLADTPVNAGGFQCVPGAHRRLGEICAKFADKPDWNPRGADTSGVLLGKTTHIPTNAGDLIIWDQRLPHGNCPNHSDKPRYSQYISFVRPSPDEQARQDRIDIFEKRDGAGGFPLDERKFELTRTPKAQLTPLGRKLLGIDRW
jgi:hypothetical protein